MDPESTPPGEDPPVSTECLTPVGGRCPPDDPGPGNVALSLVSTECSSNPQGAYMALVDMSNQTPYTWRGTFAGYGVSYDVFLTPFSVAQGGHYYGGDFTLSFNGWLDVDEDGAEGSGDINADASVFLPAPAADGSGCAPETTPPDSDDPTLQVSFEVSCAEPGTDPPYLVEFTVTNGPVSPWRGSYSTGAATENAYLTNGESDAETLPYGPPAALTVDGYFDVNTNGVQDAGDLDYSYTTPLAVPDDCPPATTDPTDTSEPTESSDSSTMSSSTTTTSTTTTTTIPPCSEVEELGVQEAPTTPAPTVPQTPPPTIVSTVASTQPPTVPPTTPASTTATTQAPRRTTTTTTASGGPGPGLLIRTTTTLRVINPPRITLPPPPGFGAIGGGVRRAVGAPPPAVGACVDTTGAMLPATGSSTVPELIVLASLLTLSGGALVAIRRRTAP
jgi:LPXTG-motif cell wall-anchored protein